MKKMMKKFVAMIAGTLLAAMPILATGIVVNAQTALNWRTIGVKDGKPYPIEGSAVGLSVDTMVDGLIVDMHYTTASYVDYNSLISQVPPEMVPDPEILDEIKNKGEIAFNLKANKSFIAGDQVFITLPYSVDGCIDEVSCDGRDQWTYSMSGTSVVFTCIDTEGHADWLSFSIEYDYSLLPNDEFWFKPMKTQLNIAAEQAQLTGKEAVAEVDGNFALSYEIMKWLEDHPNVTLKYNLTYKEKDYTIVIKGGQKLANPNIPWYGPEYLIGKFLQ